MKTIFKVFAICSILAAISINAFSQVDYHKKNLIIRNLKQIEELYIKNLNFEQRREATALMNETIELINESNSRNETPDEIVYPPACNSNNNEFLLMLEATKKAWPFKNQKTVITEYLLSHNLTALQLGELLKIIDFDDNRMELIKLVLPRVTDRHRIPLFLDAFVSPFKKEEVEKFLMNY